MQRLTPEQWLERFVQAHGTDYTYEQGTADYQWRATCNHCQTRFLLDARRHVQGQHRCRCEMTQRPFIEELPMQQKDLDRFNELYGPKYTYRRFYRQNGAKMVEFSDPDGQVYRRSVSKHLKYDPYLTGAKAE